MIFAAIADAIIAILALALLWMPSFLLSIMLFRSERRVWQLAISLGVSIILVGAIAFALSYTPLGINHTSIIGSILLLNGLCVALAVRTFRIKLSDVRQYLNKLGAAIRTNGYTAAGWITVAMLIIGLTTAVDVRQQSFTEFFLVDGYLDGTTAPWRQPQQANAPLDISFGVRSHEAVESTYHVRVIENGQEVQAIEIGVVQPGAMLRQSISLPRLEQQQRFQLLLYKDGNAQPYRELSFSLN